MEIFILGVCMVYTYVSMIYHNSLSYSQYLRVVNNEHQSGELEFNLKALVLPNYTLVLVIKVKAQIHFINVFHLSLV